MLAGIGSGNVYFKISPTREIAKMIKNCLMNFMLVLPVFSSDCRGRTGSRTAWGTGLVRIAEASWSAQAAQAARVPRLHKALRLCGVPRPHEALTLCGFPGCTNWCYQSLYTCVRFCQDEVAEFCRNRNRLL